DEERDRGEDGEAEAATWQRWKIHVVNDDNMLLPCLSENRVEIVLTGTLRA
nr:hypothetical protein [Actinomycetota bacterium]